MIYDGIGDPAVAAMQNVLAAQDVKAPHTGQPFTEAMLLGIGGGLGAGYILWEFKAEEYAIIVQGFRNRWNYTTQFLTALGQRLGASVEVQETSGAKKAAQSLDEALRSGPVIAWVDKAHLPYQHLPEALKGYVSHQVAAHTISDGAVKVSDLSPEPFAVPVKDFSDARARISSDKNRLMQVLPPDSIDLQAAVLDGIRDCVEHLGRSSESFALPVYRKWARTMTDTRNKKGWPVVFKDRAGLYSTLRSVYEGIVLDGTEGQGLRSMYADFLDEAAGAISRPALQEAAAHYREVAGLWSQLADAALPEAHFQETRDLMHQRYTHYRTHNLEGLKQVSQRMEALQNDQNRNFPLDDAAVNTLFATMQDRLEAIYDAENAALETLRAAIS